MFQTICMNQFVIILFSLYIYINTGYRLSVLTWETSFIHQEESSPCNPRCGLHPCRPGRICGHVVGLERTGSEFHFSEVFQFHERLVNSVIVASLHRLLYLSPVSYVMCILLLNPIRHQSVTHVSFDVTWRLS